jgi:oxygen-dependent protoporphyrinogen oxidase
MAELVEMLVSHLSGELRTGCHVRAIVREKKGYRLALGDGSTLHVDAVVLATPAFTSAELLENLAPEAAAAQRRIRYVSTGTLSLAYRMSDIRRPLLGFGLVVPSSERRPINAVTWCSMKFDHRAPEGHALLRVFFGGSRSPQSMALDDGELLASVRSQLREFMGIEALPLFHRIYRWDRSNAQYDVGHLDRIAALEQLTPTGIYLTGSPYRGVGLPDCIKQGQDAANRVLSRFSEKVQ